MGDELLRGMKPVGSELKGQCPGDSPGELLKLRVLEVEYYIADHEPCQPVAAEPRHSMCQANA